MFSGATQFRHTPGDATVFKIYAQYDRTDFSAYEGDERRLFALAEDNIYVNATFRYRAAGGWDWFAGAAYSYYNREVNAAAVSGDNWLERQWELHLKTKMSRRFSSVFHLDMGVESYIRNYRNCYLYSDIDDANQMSPTISAGFFSAAYYPLERLKAELSFRTEYTSLNRKMNFSPRLAVNYYLGDMMLSGIVGRYTQLPENDWLVRNRKLMSEVCMQYNLGMQYGYEGRFYKAELYYKDYSRLVLEETDAGTGSVLLTSGGYGYSRGVDLFFRDRISIKNLEYQLSYTYNISKRKYQSCSELTIPQYATRHNAALVVKYSLPRLHSIISLTNRFSTGRPYHNPLLPGLMNDEVKPYNSLDLGVTFLASKKVIIHASASNILGRKNEFGKVDNKAVLASQDRFFYVGVYVTLWKKAAYDVSNF